MSRIWVVARLVWLELLRSKDVYVLAVLLLAMLGALLGSNAFGLGGATRYVLDLGLLMTWLFSLVLAIRLTARQLPGEEKSGTIYPLLAKPVGRGELVIGKWLGAWSGSALATGVFYALTILVVLLKGGSVGVVALLQALLLHVSALAVVCALAVLVSTRSSADAAGALTWVLMAASWLIVPQVPRLAAASGAVRKVALMGVYYLLPHFELFDMRRRLVHDWGPAPWGAGLGAVLYAALLAAAFLVFAWLAYRRKLFTRGAA